MQAPAKSDLTYFNYRKTYSIVLLAICNAKNEFSLLNIGDARLQVDKGVYSNSKLGHAIDSNFLDFPNPKALPGYGHSNIFTYVFVADEAFAIKPHMTRRILRRNDPCQAETIFNYRLSRDRRVVENLFGILARRFKYFENQLLPT